MTLLRGVVALALGFTSLTANADHATAGPVGNAPIVVTTAADVIDEHDGVLSLREAVILASDQAGDDEIQLPEARYELTLGCDVPETEDPSAQVPESGDLDHSGGNLRIVGAGELGGSTISGACGGGAQNRVLDNRSEWIRLRDVVLSDGRDEFGGAIRTDRSVEFIGGGVIDSSASGPGGGVYAANGVDLIGATIRDNVAAGSGGGISAGRIDAENAEIVDNSAGLSGGGIDGRWARLELTRLVGNTVDPSLSSEPHRATGGGGASTRETLYAMRTTIAGNRVLGEMRDGGGGGGVRAGATWIQDSTVSGNQVANGSGGGVLQVTPEPPDHTGSGLFIYTATISGNSVASGIGGG
ncbi:MAG: hypothetical protein AAGK32_04860, partial [Actinomycetota bacterium]